MVTRFPGMDPFLEGQRWEGFHVRCMAVISHVLVPQVRPRNIEPPLSEADAAWVGQVLELGS